MSLEEKYKSVLELGKALEVIGGSVVEANGKLKIGGKTKTQFEKDQLWDEIKKVGGESPSDMEAYINVEQTEFYTKHTVIFGESLSLIAKRYYKDPMKYDKIFDVNTHILKNPNVVQPGQELTIPFV